MKEKITIEEYVLLLEDIFKDAYHRFPAVEWIISGIRKRLKEIEQ